MFYKALYIIFVGIHVGVWGRHVFPEVSLRFQLCSHTSTERTRAWILVALSSHLFFGKWMFQMDAEVKSSSDVNFHLAKGNNISPT